MHIVCTSKKIRVLIYAKNGVGVITVIAVKKAHTLGTKAFKRIPRFKISYLADYLIC